MDFVSSREGFAEPEASSTIFRDNNNYQNQSFNCSSSTNNSGVWEAHQTREDHCEMGTWLGHKLESYPEISTEGAGSHRDFMELSPPKMEDDEDNSSMRNTTTSSGTNTCVQKEHMFDKAVTPSDVGKLNRLVIPKQHAERFFPLDSSTIDKGLLLSFEDGDGKSWRFRYSYWNSSQSYVMTKGWSRFVKDKKLDAGDIVSFQRGVGEKGKDRLYIDCRRRPDGPNPSAIPNFPLPHQFSLYRSVPWNSPVLVNHPTNSLSSSRDHLHLSQFTSGNYNFHRNDYNFHQVGFGYGNLSYGNIANRPVSGGSMLQFRSNYNNASTWQKGTDIAPGQRGGVGGGVGSGGGMEQPVVFDSVPVVVQGKAASKRLRLFGVNVECPMSESDESEILSSTTVRQHPMMSTTQHPSLLSSSSSQSNNTTATPSQLMYYNGTPLRPRDSSSAHKGKASMTLDFDI